MLIRTAEPACLVPELDTGFVAGALASVPAAVDSVSMREVTVLDLAFGLAGLALAGLRFDSDWARALAVLVLCVQKSELVCALAGNASIIAKKGAITRTRKCL